MSHRAKRALIIDNFDSFTFNLVQGLGVLGTEISVIRNNEGAADDVIASRPDLIVISPGPGNPDEAGISREVIRMAAGRIPVLGVCLGHQCIGEVYGGRVVRVPPVHGKVSAVHHDGRGVFRGLPSPILAARYHSLAVDPASVSSELEISARTEDGVIMGLRHRAFAVEGIQFHPESFMTPEGMRMMKYFLEMGSTGV